MLKRIRRTLAIFMFVGITLLFLDFTGTLHAWLSWTAAFQLVPAILALNVAVIAVLLLLTLLFGRIYCSVICPLGILQDIVSRIRITLNKRLHLRPRLYAYHKALPVVRYAFLVLFVVLVAAGLTSIAGLLDPYSAFGRIATNLFGPLYGWGNNLLAATAEHYESYAFYSTEVWMRSLPSLIVAMVTLVIVVGFALFTGRDYCNTICPVGTFLGLFSRYSRLKVVIDTNRCNACGRCARHCKAHCIDTTKGVVDYSRCVVCGNCLGNCNYGALSYGHKPTIDRENTIAAAHEESTAAVSEEKEGLSRRTFLLSTAAVTAGAALAQAEKKVDGGLAIIEDKVVPERKGRLVPPGAQSQRHFYQNCTACQLCVSACPNGVLRPSDDLQHFMQPVMEYERGYCRPECTRCSEVCPNDAIRLIDLAEKSSVKIGTARVIAANCLTNAGVSCGNCARHCPVGAIQMVNFHPDEADSLPSPVVDPERCIGCGACENLCPVRPLSAIIVDGIEQHRTI